MRQLPNTETTPHWLKGGGNEGKLAGTGEGRCDRGERVDGRGKWVCAPYALGTWRRLQPKCLKVTGSFFLHLRDAETGEEKEEEE